MKFRYVKIRFGEGPTQPIRPRPFVRIRVGAPADASIFIHLFALVDSGADQSIFPVEVATKLGIDLTKAKTMTVMGIGGGKLQAWLHPVTVAIDPSWSITLPAAFVDDRQTIPILGQEGFFDQALVMFNRPKEEIEIKPIETSQS